MKKRKAIKQAGFRKNGNKKQQFFNKYSTECE